MEPSDPDQIKVNDFMSQSEAGVGKAAGSFPNEEEFLKKQEDFDIQEVIDGFILK